MGKPTDAPRPRGTIVVDAEQVALSKATALIVGLDEPARQRVMAYLVSRFGPTGVKPIHNTAYEG